MMCNISKLADEFPPEDLTEQCNHHYIGACLRVSLHIHAYFKQFKDVFSFTRLFDSQVISVQVTLHLLVYLFG